MALPLYIGFLLNCFFIITMMFREGQALRPTKSEWDSAVLEGLCGERGCCPFAMVVEWKGSVQREERAPPLRKARVTVRMRNKQYFGKK